MDPRQPSEKTFRKLYPAQPGDHARAEVAGLRWITLPNGPRIIDVISRGAGYLDLRLVETVPPTAEAAQNFGHQLAVLHNEPAPAFGCPPTDAPPHGWIGMAPMPYGLFDDFPAMYSELKMLPYIERARSAGYLSAREAQRVSEVCAAIRSGAIDMAAPAQPRRLHGDLWSGNVLWEADPTGRAQCTLIDPAAYGGHPETDIAMLQLFGFPHWDAFISEYATALPLAPGWERRVPAHQLYPLLVHVVLFGRSYVPQLLSCVTSTASLST